MFRDPCRGLTRPWWLVGWYGPTGSDRFGPDGPFRPKRWNDGTVWIASWVRQDLDNSMMVPEFSKGWCFNQTCQPSQMRAEMRPSPSTCHPEMVTMKQLTEAARPVNGAAWRLLRGFLDLCLSKLSDLRAGTVPIETGEDDPFRRREGSESKGRTTDLLTGCPLFQWP